MVIRPINLTIRTYQVGFGDCFLLTVTYDSGESRHALIDFGTTRPYRGFSGRTSLEIANDIKDVTNNKLHMVVATHRHQDHVSGFAGASGAVVSSLSPEIVVQPWTEDPALAVNATAPLQTSLVSSRSLVSALGSMQEFAASVQQQWMEVVGLDADTRNTGPGSTDLEKIEKLLVDDQSRTSRLLGIDMSQAVPRTVFMELLHIGITNISNRAAVENLISMAENANAGGHYARYGDRLDLAGILPGVRARVLGPPTVDQWPAIRGQRHKDKDEFWHLRQQFWRAHAASEALASRGSLFEADTVDDIPFSARWVVPRAQRARFDQLLSIVRALDTALNNTSVILLFEIGDQKLLFPGDAQIENWEYVLDKAQRDTKEGRELRELLSTVDLYKVGHHGSLNATPKTLWNMFQKKGSRVPVDDRMRSIVSTRSGVHGNRSKRTEVPRQTLIDALRRNTRFHTTQTQRRKAEYVHTTEIPIGPATL